MPSSKTTATVSQTGFAAALGLFRQAASRVPAYKDFLAKHRVNPAAIQTPDDFRRLPLIDKPSYFDRYSLAELSWDGKLNPRIVSMSSGSTGQAYYWPRGAEPMAVVDGIFEQLYRQVFRADQQKTLVILCFGLGSWIAGLENFLSTLAASNSQQITVFAAGLEQAEALRAVKKLSADFDQTILCGYPPFMKDTLEAGAKEGIAWAKLNTRLLTAGEAISETWRQAVLQILGQAESTAIINYYGMAEAGTIAHETAATINLRRQLAPSAVPQLFSDSGVAAIYQYHPKFHYFESVDGELVLTYAAGLPLIRYRTGDQGGVLNFDEAQQLVDGRLDDTLELPMVYLFGRRNLSATLYAVNIYPENIKAALEQPRLARYLTGRFQISTRNGRNQNQFLEVLVETGDKKLPSDFRRQLQKAIIEKLLELNSEYRKLRGAVGVKANPRIKLVTAGKLGFIAGRKYRWVKPV